MLVSAEEVLDVRGSLLHVTETEAILLQLLRQLSLHQPKGLIFFFFLFFLLSNLQTHKASLNLMTLTDCRPIETELRLKHILLEASGQIQLHRDVAQVSHISLQSSSFQH